MTLALCELQIMCSTMSLEKGSRDNIARYAFNILTGIIEDAELDMLLSVQNINDGTE